jgi:methionyl-tRNA formyltransferase
LQEVPFSGSMLSMNYVVATIKPWNLENFRVLRASDPGNVWTLIDRREDLTLERLDSIQPRFVFFPHWSWIIPKEIFKAYECVVFHMTDLPYGRGGSPLQNLIIRGHTETKVSAIHVSEKVDAGDVYMKAPLSLEGSADAIYRRASGIVFDMIRSIVRDEPRPVPQEGTAVTFRRRTPAEGNLADAADMRQVYDMIRMLDADGYPRAFLTIGSLRLEFDSAEQDVDQVIARVRITKGQTK